MKKNKILITTHSLSEAITKCVINNRQYFDETIAIVSLQELMTDYTIFDELTDSKNIIRWNKGNDLCISNADYYLLNRVLYMPHSLFNDFISQDKEYAQRELEAYIGFSFNAFIGVGNKSPKGSVGDILSLPQQWDSIKNKFNINVPHYYWGPNYHNHLKNCDELIYSSIYNYLNWSSLNNLPYQNHVFCFNKPKGKPVFVLSIGNQQLVNSDFEFSLEIKDELCKIVAGIYYHYGYFIFEALFFIDDQINFACINHEIIQSSKNSNYEKFVCDNLISEFYKCMN